MGRSHIQGGRHRLGTAKRGTSVRSVGHPDANSRPRSARQRRRADQADKRRASK